LYTNSGCYPIYPYPLQQPPVSTVGREVGVDSLLGINMCGQYRCSTEVLGCLSQVQSPLTHKLDLLHSTAQHCRGDKSN